MSGFLTFKGSEAHPRWLAASELRQRVFVGEQQVPFVLEVDARDFLESTLHIVLTDEANLVVGVARILRGEENDYYVGRVVVDPVLRGRGLGQQLILEASRQVALVTPVGDTASVRLDSQVQAIGFYEICGYELTGEGEFIDAGIPHRGMIKRIPGEKLTR